MIYQIKDGKKIPLGAQTTDFLGDSPLAVHGTLNSTHNKDENTIVVDVSPLFNTLPINYIVIIALTVESSADMFHSVVSAFKIWDGSVMCYDMVGSTPVNTKPVATTQTVDVMPLALPNKLITTKDTFTYNINGNVNRWHVGYVLL